VSQPFLQHRRVRIWTLHLAGRRPEDESIDGFALVGMAGAVELAAAMDVPLAFVTERLAWSRCYAGWVDGRIVSYGWVSAVATPIGEIDSTIQPDPGEAYIWDCVTAVAYRGRGLYRRLLIFILRDLTRDQVQRVWIATVEENGPGRQGAQRAGFQPVLRIRYLRLGAWRRRWVRGVAGATPEEQEAARQRLRIGSAALAATTSASAKS